MRSRERQSPDWVRRADHARKALRAKTALGIGIRRHLDQQYSWINLDVDLDLDFGVDLDVRKQDHKRKSCNY